MWEAISKEKNLRLVIEKDEYVGYYLYVFEYKADKSYRDDLYDNLEQIYNAVQDEFGISRDEFKETK